MKFSFYYDESEHSRKININTVKAENYYDNFVAFIVGWNALSEAKIIGRYLEFEETYSARQSKGELKSQTLKQSQFKNGFASMNKDNVKFLDDFLSLFGEDILLYFSIASKTEYIINQIFDGYENSLMVDMDSMKYSITKAVLAYRPENIIDAVFTDTGELVEALKRFFTERIEKNRKNVSLKEAESKAFSEIVQLLEDVHSAKEIDWSYEAPFYGFGLFLNEIGIEDYTLCIDKEGQERKTLNAALKVGLYDVFEADSKTSVGIRMADMLAGVVAKLLKAIHSALLYQSEEETVKKKLLSSEWFILTEPQLELYKKMYKILCVTNDAWYKTYFGRYADDAVMLFALLEYMNQFASTSEMHLDNMEMHGEYFNSVACDRLQEQFQRMRNKLPIDIEKETDADYTFNRRGAKIWKNINRQPCLLIDDHPKTYLALSVGVLKGGIPVITIQEDDAVNCYRLPYDLSEWAETVVGMANMGENLFPSQVRFVKIKSRSYADIL